MGVGGGECCGKGVSVDGRQGGHPIYEGSGVSIMLQPHLHFVKAPLKIAVAQVYQG